MTISTKGRYALRVMLDIATRGQDQLVSLRSVAENQDVSYKYLEQIIIPMVREGLLTSVRGAHGGYQLAKPADQITAGEVLRAAEGELSPIHCVMNQSNCPRADCCQALPFWMGLAKAIDDYVDKISLAELVERGEDL